jgi:archaetidylinositol phosphate synthase
MNLDENVALPHIADHRRVNTSVLAPLERPLLRSLARVVAPRASADACTVVGIGGAVICFLGYALSRHSTWFVGLATLGVVVHWLGDSLDGTVARLRGAQRPRYGFFADHFADTLCQVLMFVGLGLSPFITLSVACLSLATFQAIAILVFLRTAVLGEFQLAFGKVGPTEGHALLVLQGLTIMVLGPLRLGDPGVGLSGYDIPVAAYGALAAFQFLRVGIKDVMTLRASNE